LFDRPLRVVAFSEEGWLRDVTEEIASKLPDLSRQGRMLACDCERLVERVTGQAATIIV
jgi:hypothetical protein